jgi:hypothetical protein
MAQKTRWQPVMLPENYLRKMKQDLAELEAIVESKTRYEPDPDFSPSARRGSVALTSVPASPRIRP